ncbi:cupin domain-containing protein [Actinospica sp.]|jgi:mannose-6-phosphate isomerase-like protein (cupin superfamily)|uniref:cupin domain-containing protein n=1 Tax=Actinospica sp. TaxID=1872142 RepID=UPI002BE5C0F0|nr:cupin domain-containing protein [Actinospica sp.]HWG23966.1 cupin domain-containing protein [Actinospica sp.]
MVTARPAFPGAAAVSGLRVYDWSAEDGLCGGSPHVHLACTEAYLVVGGRGALHTLTVAGLERTPLHAGVVAWFGPGTVHRAVNLDGALKVVVVMQNSGLPEAGDAVLTFPPEHLESADSYRLAATAEDDAGARRRRDLAVAGYLSLLDAVAAGDPGPLAEFYRQAVRLRSELFDSWEKVLRSGALAAAERTADELTALRQGRIDHLLDAALRVEDAPEPAQRAFGMCGRLDRYKLG